MISEYKEQAVPTQPVCTAVMKAIMETTKQQIASDGWWTEPEQERMDVRSGEDCFV